MFRSDERFVNAFKSWREQRQGTKPEWRLHVLTWAASQALHIKGDFVECGVLARFSSAVVCKYLDFAAIPRSFYLYDNVRGDARGNVQRGGARQRDPNPTYAADPAEWLAFVQGVLPPFPMRK